MASRQINQKKVYGLELQSNSFAVREGSLEIAKDIVISQDNIIKKRRGNKSFYTLNAVDGRSLTEFQGKLVGICGDRVQVYNQNADGTFSSVSALAGEAFTVASGSKSRTAQSNGNLYFTADQGIKKLESVTGAVLDSGIDSATDIQVITQVKSATETYFRPGSQISYRVVFGRKDANNNLVLGAPSQVVTATNFLVSATSSQAGTTLTITSTAHGLVTGDIVYISDANGDTTPDGAYTATVTNANVFTIPVNAGTGPTTLTWGTYKTITLDFAVPSGNASTEFIWQLYRTNASAASDIIPDESTLQQIEEKNLTSTEVSTGFVIYVDETPDILRGAYLYTNPNTGEPRGIAEANEKAPYAADIAVFKNHTFFANVQTPYTLALNLITANATDTPDGAEFTFTSGVTVRTYIGKIGPKVGNRTVRATSVSNVTTTVTVNYVGHGAAVGDTIAVAQALDAAGAQLATLPQGNYVVATAAADSFTFTAPGTPAGITSLSFAHVQTAAGKRVYYIEDSATSTVAAAIDATARAIVRAVNRDSSSPCYGYYLSSAVDIPGRMAFRSTGVTATFNINSVTAALNESFSPNLATTGATVVGTRDDGQGVLYFSKQNRPEAVPLANQMTIGSKSSAILRIKPLRDSLIVVKEDGVYRVNGDNYTSFVATILDNTVFCKAADSVATLNNTVYFVSNQGVVSISETTAQIVSRPIEPILNAIIGKSYFSAQTHACAYDSEKLYLLTTVSPQASTADTVYCYNQLTEGWSTWSTTFSDAFVKPSDDKLYYYSLGNVLLQERKLQNRLDYCDDDFATTVLTTPTSTTATLSIVGGTASVGDIVVINSIINRITAIESDGSDLVYTFARAFSFAASDTGLLYHGIRSIMRFSPLADGDNSVWKQFSEFQAHFRNNASCSRMTAYFLTDSVSGSETTSWESEVQGQGWGELPWGQFPWGLEEGINAQYDTTATQIMRIYVPLEAERATFIQAHLEHRDAAENIMMQAIAYTARRNGQRVTR